MAVLCGGCSAGISASDAASVRQDFSQERYERAMRKAGRGAEVEKEKSAAAERDQESTSSPQ
jgi:hypothetical protein